MALPAKDVVIMAMLGSPAAWASIGVFQNVQLQITNTEEDVSTKADNQARILYSAGAQKAYSVSGEALLDAGAGLSLLKDAAGAADPKANLRLDDGVDTYTGDWLVAQFQVQGGSFGAAKVSATLQSASAIVVAAS